MVLFSVIAISMAIHHGMPLKPLPVLNILTVISGLFCSGIPMAMTREFPDKKVTFWSSLDIFDTDYLWTILYDLYISRWITLVITERR